MSVRGGSRVTRREKPKLSMALPGPIAGRWPAQMLHPVQNEVSPLRPKGVAKRSACLPQERGLTVLHGDRRHARTKLARASLGQRPQQSSKLTADAPRRPRKPVRPSVEKQSELLKTANDQCVCCLESLKTCDSEWKIDNGRVGLYHTICSLT